LKKNKSILRQLLLNILLPVFIILLIFSGINYQLNKNKLQESYLKEREQVTGEVKSFLSLYDASLQLIEKELDEEITRISDLLINDYFLQTDSISTCDLTRIAMEAGIDTSAFDIYIINRDGIITNTTFTKDQGLNFYKINKEFKIFFEKIFASKKLNIDRLGGEMATRRTKKYSYTPTFDGKFIIELGVYSDQADEMEKKVNLQIDHLKSSFPELDEIKSFRAIENFKNDEIPAAHKKEYQKAIVQKTSVRVTEKKDDLEQYYDYIYIHMPGAALYSGYILLVVSDDSREKKLLANELVRFIWIMLGTLVPLALLVYFRSKAIIKPIRVLNEKVQVISRGNLAERVPVAGNNEITTLSSSFNKMVDELQDLYEGLEQKVVARTVELQHQKEIVEEKQKEIIDSINYAKRLQDAILPPQKLIDEFIPQNFVLYKPKDIVAGDFYWAEKTADYFFIAAADCTGHGVPGAMVSVVCSNAMNRAVKEFNLTETGRILDKATDLVIATFEKSDEDVKDGMDISLLGIHLKTGKITWSGANNPLWYISNRELTEIKADKQPIGKSENRKAFTTHELVIDKGTMIYLFTDGYADQFGGEKGKKFKYKPFSEMLIANAKLPMELQRKNLDEKIEFWKSDLEQNDDICVIGVKI
jgi:phosphoserine phosphatase RsbU/P